eukprot:675185-Karenia_brevis.AAC.1
MDMLLISSGESATGIGGHISEVYSPPRIAPVAYAAGMSKGWSLDLTTSDDQGRPWNFDDPQCRLRAKDLVRKTKPLLLVGSPMCTWFSTLMNLNFPKMDPTVVAQNLDRAIDHLKSTLELYQIQLDGGRYFLHEHPAGASSWKLPEMVQFMEQAGIVSAVSNMCCFGMETTSLDGEASELVAKPTRFMTNAEELLKIIHRRCEGGHKHGRLISGRAKGAAVYPPALCKSVVYGIQRQVAQDQRSHQSSTLGKENEAPEIT